MTKHELFGLADGLRRTADNAIKSRHGALVAEAIARQATESLVRMARGLSESDPALLRLDVVPGITWSEIRSIADAVCQFASRNGTY